MNTVVVTSPVSGGEGAAADPVPGEAAVEIAEIQAERDVGIAEIQAGTTALALETQQDEDETWLRDELAGLHASHAASAENLSRVEQSLQALAEQTQLLASQVQDLTAQLPLLTPPPLLAEPLPSTPAEPVVEPDAGADGPQDRKKPEPRRLRWL